MSFLPSPRPASILVAASALVLSSQAVAYEGVGLPVAEIQPGQLRIDGLLRDWERNGFAESGNDRRAGWLRYALGYDAGALYVGLEVTDDVFVRTRRPGPREDAVVITLAFPGDRKGHIAYELWLFAGIPGRQASLAFLGRPGSQPKPLDGVKIVEAERSHGSGYTLEAQIPWRRIPRSATWQRSRAEVRLHDIDDPRGPARLSSRVRARKRRTELGRLPRLLPSGGSEQHLKGFLESIGRPVALPRFDLRGDVFGDGRAERVIVVDRYLVVTGEGYKDGESCDYVQLPIAVESDVRTARLRDLTGDGRSELLLRFRHRTDFGSREVWRAIGFTEAGPQALLSLETMRRSASSRVEATVEVLGSGRRRPPIVRVRAGRAQGPDPRLVPLDRVSDDAPVLVAWGLVIQRDYQWDRTRFSVRREIANNVVLAPARPAGPEQPPRPKAPASASAPAAQLDAVVALFRRTRGLGPEVAPRFAIQANVAEDARAEQVQVLGTLLLVAGPGFRGGRGYVYIELPVDRPEDVLAVTARDVTGDARADVLVRVRQHLGELQRDVLVGYRIDGRSPARFMALPLRYRQGMRSIENQVRFLTTGRGCEIRVTPGRARGWSEQSFVYSPDGSDGVLPILLPWRDGPVRYRFDNGSLLRAER